MRTEAMKINRKNRIGASKAIRMLIAVWALVAVCCCASIEERWHEAQSIHTIEAYKEFFESCNDSFYADRARAAIAECRYSHAESVDSLDVWIDFISDYPESKYCTDVTRRIVQLTIRDIPAMHISVELTPADDYSLDLAAATDLVKSSVAKDIMLYTNAEVIDPHCTRDCGCIEIQGIVRPEANKYSHIGRLYTSTLVSGEICIRADGRKASWTFNSSSKPVKKFYDTSQPRSEWKLVGENRKREIRAEYGSPNPQFIMHDCAELVAEATAGLFLDISGPYAGILMLSSPHDFIAKLAKVFVQRSFSMKSVRFHRMPGWKANQCRMERLSSIDRARIMIDGILIDEDRGGALIDALASELLNIGIEIDKYDFMHDKYYKLDQLWRQNVEREGEAVVEDLQQEELNLYMTFSEIPYQYDIIANYSEFHSADFDEGECEDEYGVAPISKRTMLNEFSEEIDDILEHAREAGAEGVVFVPVRAAGQERVTRVVVYSEMMTERRSVLIDRRVFCLDAYAIKKVSSNSFESRVPDFFRKAIINKRQRIDRDDMRSRASWPDRLIEWARRASRTAIF